MCAYVSAEAVSTLEAELGAERIGPSMWGDVYRSLDHARCYRLIAGENGVSANQKEELQRLRERPRQRGIAPVIDVGWRSIDERWFVVVTYEIATERTLVQALATDDPADRVRTLATVLRAVPSWWARIGRGFIPMPSDVVFAGGIPQLLAVPPWGSPSVEVLFAERERALYLPPEIVRGDDASVWGNSSDLFCLGVMLLQCFVVLPDGDAGRLLQQVACGAAFVPARCESRLPFWLQKVDAVQRALEAARGLTGPDPRARSALDPLELAEQLDVCAPAMNPITAVEELRQAGKPEEAVELARAVLVDEPSYELLLLAAEIAWKDLENPLEGLSLLDNAVVAAPGRTEAYAAQVALISDLRTDIIARLAYAIDPSFAERLDRTMDVAFARIPAEEQDARAGDMASYLIERDQLVRANEFAYERLHEGERLLWWKFDLMLAYAETFLRLGRLEEARQQIDRTKGGLRRVRQQGSIPESEIQRYGSELLRFDHELHRRQRGG